MAMTIASQFLLHAILACSVYGVWKFGAKAETCGGQIGRQ